MSISDKFKDLKFSKSISGYNCAEVDGFINDIFPLIAEQEQLLAALKVKLEAFEAQRDGVAENERRARKLLEAARDEAEIIVASAKASAESTAHDAKVTSEVQLRSANTRATEIIASAESTAKMTVNDAKKNAERIIREADAEARATIEKVRAYSEEERRKIAELSAECYNFETRFRTLVTDTAKAFAQIKEQVPIKPAVTEEAPGPAEELKTEEKAEEATKAVELTEPETVTDIEIAGGKPIVKKNSAAPKKHFYDTVTVVYDDTEESDGGDGDFEDIKDIMSRMKKRKGPTDFSE